MKRVMMVALAMTIPGTAMAQIGRDTGLAADAFTRARNSCGYRYEEGVRQCRPAGSCTERLEQQRAQCITAAERSYARALRQLMRPSY